jgi:hypothetical protein
MRQSTPPPKEFEMQVQQSGKPKKLTGAQIAVLSVAVSLGGRIDFHRAARSGGNGKTLSTLTERGYLTKLTDRGMNDWDITESGRSAIAKATGEAA